MKDFGSLSIAIACDHAGYEMKEEMLRTFAGKFFELKDFGTFSNESCDYPDFIHPMASAVNSGKYDFGIAICGTGNGVSMTANKYPNVRAALCWQNSIVKLARQHNNANIISLPARFISQADAEFFVETFLTTDYEGGRHQRRIDKISQTI